LVEFIGTEVDNSLVVTARVEHKDMSATNMNEGLWNACPYTGVGLEMALNGQNRAMDAVLEDGDRVRDGGLDKFLGQPGFK